MSKLPLPARSKPGHGIQYRPDRPTIINDTVCVHDRQPLLANDSAHSALREVWLKADRWLVGRYMIMPDHIHYFASPAIANGDFERWVRYWKSQFRKATGIRLQTGHWDHRIRSAKHYQEKWEYVERNPVRKNLVESPELWPFQGELYQLEWR